MVVCIMMLNSLWSSDDLLCEFPVSGNACSLMNNLQVLFSLQYHDGVVSVVHNISSGIARI